MLYCTGLCWEHGGRGCHTCMHSTGHNLAVGTVESFKTMTGGQAVG